MAETKGIASGVNGASDDTKVPHATNWIDGEWVDSEQHSESYDPATGRHIGTYADGGVPEAQRCIDAALRAFKYSGWKEDRMLRARVLNQMADSFEALRAELIDTLALENG
jgi:betaine-aldehyde dehydrogenase